MKFVFFTCAGQIKLSRIKIHNVGVCVAKMVQPPVLMSRIMTFVLATSIVVLAALVVTLYKMIPLERPQVFFLLTNNRPINTVIEPLVPDSTNEQAIENYEKGFVREYIITRNTLDTNAVLTRTNWTSIIRNWSSEKVYSALTKTELYKEYTLSDRPPMLSCLVNFIDVDKTASKTDYDEYVTNFMWICKNIGGQTVQKNYKIRLRIQSVLGKNASDTLENLNKLRNNPLGIRVVSYTVIEGEGDPLNAKDLILYQN